MIGPGGLLCVLRTYWAHQKASEAATGETRRSESVIGGLDIKCKTSQRAENKRCSATPRSQGHAWDR